MIIIVEGCDGAGKTTFVEKLAKVVRDNVKSERVEVLHKGPMTSDAITEYEGPLEEYMPGGDQTFICDRWHVGELVYGPVLRGETKMNIAEQRHIDKFLLARGAILVHMDAPLSVLAQRVKDRGDDLIKVDQLAEIVDRYHRVIWHVALPTWALLPGYDDDTVIEVANFAIQYEQFALLTKDFLTYVGPPRPTYLLLGEKRGPNRGRYDGRGAFVPMSATSGEYLLRNLPPDVGDVCGLANALEEDIGELYDRLGRPPVVALGREAQQQCLMAEIPHGAVPHPQYVRRFHHAEGQRYGAMIRQAAIHREDLTGVFGHPRS